MKGYVIGLINVQNPDAYKEYTGLGPSSLEPYGGHFIVRAGQHQFLEGDVAANRVVLIEFDSYEKALEWYNSDNYQAAKFKRLAASTGNLIVAQGI